MERILITLIISALSCFEAAAQKINLDSALTELDRAIKLSPEYELAVWKKEDFLQQSRFAICHCRECQRPFAVQKEIDYAIALLKHNGDTRAELHRESFETCPECKRQKCLVPSDRIELTRHMREAS